MTCQMLGVATEPAKDRLIRELQRQVDGFHNARLRGEHDDDNALRARIADLEATIRRQNTRLARRSA